MTLVPSLGFTLPSETCLASLVPGLSPGSDPAPDRVGTRLSGARLATSRSLASMGFSTSKSDFDHLVSASPESSA
jgi:hypothetical protein